MSRQAYCGCPGRKARGQSNFQSAAPVLGLEANKLMFIPFKEWSLSFSTPPVKDPFTFKPARRVHLDAGPQGGVS